MEDETKDPRSVPPKDGPRRRPYATPRVQRLGTLTEMTALSGSMSAVDDGHGSGNKTE
jgi:hypothetical protein